MLVTGYWLHLDDEGIQLATRNTVEPVLRAAVFSGHPLLTSRLSESQIFSPYCNFYFY